MIFVDCCTEALLHVCLWFSDSVSFLQGAHIVTPFDIRTPRPDSRLKNFAYNRHAKATSLLWEARNAAEFASAARAAAATQRAAEARGVCNIRREHKIAVRKHKRELLHVSGNRAVSYTHLTLPTICSV